MGLSDIPSFLRDAVHWFFFSPMWRYLVSLLQVDAIGPAVGRLGQPPGVECLSKLTLTHKMPANVRQCRYDMAGQSGLSGTWMTLNQGWIFVHFLSQNYSSCARLYPVEKNGLFQAGLRDRRSQGLGVSSARRLAACWNTSISDGYCSIPQSSVWVSRLTTQIPFSHINPLWIPGIFWFSMPFSLWTSNMALVQSRSL